MGNAYPPRLVPLQWARPGPTAKPAAPSTTPLGGPRKIVLIPGFVVGGKTCLELYTDESCTKAYSRSGYTFDGLLAELRELAPETDILRFNYSPFWRTQDWYPSEDTHAPISVLATHFEEQMSYWSQLHGPGTRFQIISHSLGGAVVTYWAGSTKDRELLRSVHSVSTLDSPLNGISSGVLEFLAKFIGCGPMPLAG